MSLFCPKCGYHMPDDLLRDAALELEEDRYVQLLNPRSKKWVLIDKWTGRTMGHYDEQVPLVPVKGKESDG